MHSRTSYLFLVALTCVIALLQFTECVGGRMLVSPPKMHRLRSMDVSNHHFTSDRYSDRWNAAQINEVQEAVRPMDEESSSSLGPGEHLSDPPSDPPSDIHPPPGKKAWYGQGIVLIPAIFVGILILYFLAYYVKRNAAKLQKEKVLKSLAHSPSQTTPAAAPTEEEKPEERSSELVFFVEEHEKFELDDLLEATADLRSQNLCSSLYKVVLKNSGAYAVKRLKKLQVSFEEFGRTMRQIGSLKHPNILSLVAYNSTNEEKLLIYKFQRNGSLLNLLNDYIEGKRDFPWKLRLSIVSGIVRGLDFIYQNSAELGSTPHGNLKLSNILLGENMEPLISEYGFSIFLDPTTACLLSSNGYTAPEKTLSEQGDVFSFGIILLELLTGKTVEKSGIDLPKWVRSMVREEWTGEVFDGEVNRAARDSAFPLLNVALKCVSVSPEDRPTVAEVVEKIEELVCAHEDISVSSMNSIQSSPLDTCLLHTVIPETWDTPGSNY